MKNTLKKKDYKIAFGMHLDPEAFLFSCVRCAPAGVSLFCFALLHVRVRFLSGSLVCFSLRVRELARRCVEVWANHCGQSRPGGGA